MKQKFSALANRTNVLQLEDPKELLTLINMVCMTPASYSREERMHTARTSYHTLKQWKQENLDDFRKRFDAAIETLRQFGVDDAQLPTDAIRAVDYANALDKTRFAEILVDYKNGLLPGLGSVDKVQARAECYVTLQSQQADRPTPIFLRSETRKLAGNTSSKQNTRNKCGGTDQNAAKKSNCDRSNKKKGSGKRPSADNRCYTCGAADHFARDYPDGKDTNEQQVAPGTSLISMTSMIIPHDAMDHYDLADNLNENDTAIEASALLSIIEAEKVSIKSYIIVGADSLPYHYILLDTCGSANVFSNANLLVNIRPASHGLIMGYEKILSQ
jgi:hypothetical protein